MVSFIVRIIVNGLALWVATEIVSGVNITSADSTTDRVLTFGVIALIFALVNAFIKPVVQLLTLPLFILTLGLFTFIVNALMLWLTGWIADQLDVPFEVADFFWAAVLGALVVSFVSWILNLLLPK
ncbi:phage holin family protein [Phytoactinopolyspora halotolerans]|uniref:Phage holin family protein n=1 Tax=Phytoactinopolyspora halotolerans TaxID=1981512 RepID=A0A6L9S0L9_9ACTN|nr:phage holin family protein [Phytoactinopolyspora halotolerans]NED99004.1 phage holin family protein [Phytoactinopolyspora halotolerans]